MAARTQNTSVRGNFLLIKATILLTVLLLPTSAWAYPAIEQRSRIENDSSLVVGTNSLKNVPPHLAEQLVDSVKHRQKRLSDQRRAELETLMALSKVSGKLVNASRGGRQTDATKSDRRRRSVLDNLMSLNFLFQLSGSLSQKGNRAFPATG